MKKLSVGVWITLFGCNATASTVRTLWYFEQLALPPRPSTFGQRTTQLELGAVNYGDAIATRASTSLDLRWLELSAGFGQRFFLDLTPDGSALGSALNSVSRNASLEVAKSYTSPSGVYGRMGTGFVPFLPSGTTYWNFSIASGLLPSANVPFEFRLLVSVLASFAGKGTVILARADTARDFFLSNDRVMALGGFFSFCQSYKASNGEYILFSLGPTLYYQSTLGRLTLSSPIRVWLDRSSTGAFNTAFTLPTFALGWQTFL